MGKRQWAGLWLVSVGCCLLLAGCGDKGDTAKGLGRLPEEVAAFQQEDRVAVIVGIDAYQPESDFRPLNYAVKDAEALKITLEKRGYKVKLLTNGQAKKHFILQAIQEAGKLLEPERGTLVFFFTGHGFVGKTPKGEDDNFLAVDGTTSYDLSNSGLGLADVKATLKATKARRNMVFIDACRNNPLLKPEKSGDNPSFAALAESEGLNVLYSTAPGDVSVETADFQHGLFTHFLLEGLEGKAGQNGMVLFDGLADYVTTQVKNYSFEHLPKTQKPYRSSESSGQFLVATLPDFNPDTLPPPNPTVESSTVPTLPAAQTVPAPTASPANSDVAAGVAAYRKNDFATALQQLTPLAEQGNGIAQAYVGQMYFYGKGTGKNETTALEWFNKALPWLQQEANQGNPLAQLNLGNMYSNGYGVKQDYVEALNWFRKAADQGDSWGQKNLGGMYATGRGVKQDYAEALNWYRKAADQGNTDGQYGLGVAYRDGYAVKQDYVEALNWFRKAADQGYADGQVNLGLMYEQGKGVKQDSAEAVNWYRKAADQGNAYGQAGLGRMYATGRGVKQNSAEAVNWYRKAADQGYADGQVNLGLMYEQGQGVKQDSAEAVNWYRKAAEQGNAYGQVGLGRMYATGRGVKQDSIEAVNWYRKAAEQGNAGGQANLGYLYETGKGVKKSSKTAIAWYRKAAAQGNAYAKDRLKAWKK
jgi:hypothetical protein